LTTDADSARGPLFQRDGELVIPSAYAAGPWDAAALHGGSAGALMSWAMEALDPDPGMPFARVTCEFVRPVPVAPLRVSAAVRRPGRKVQLLEAKIRSGDEVVARASGLRIRAGDSEVPAGALPDPEPLPAPEAGRAPMGVDTWGRGLNTWMDLRVVRGEMISPGAAAAWFRLGGALVDGEPPTPLQRAVMAADFGNGLSGILDFRTHVFINPDLTVYLHRYPSGEWVGLDSVSWIHTHGVGLAESTLWDQEGPIGRSMQSLLVGKRA
jgi:hypothetical protein